MPSRLRTSNIHIVNHKYLIHNRSLSTKLCASRYDCVRNSEKKVNSVGWNVWRDFPGASEVEFELGFESMKGLSGIRKGVLGRLLSAWRPARCTCEIRKSGLS